MKTKKLHLWFAEEYLFLSHIAGSALACAIFRLDLVRHLTLLRHCNVIR